MLVRGDARQAKAEVMTGQNPLVSGDYCSKRKMFRDTPANLKALNLYIILVPCSFAFSFPPDSLLSR